MRANFTRKIKAAAYDRCKIDGVACCEGLKCDTCGEDHSKIGVVGAACDRCRSGRLARCGLPLHPTRFTYDHTDPDYFSKDNSLENCKVLGWCCDRPKTKKDKRDIAKSKRVRDTFIKAKSARRPFRGWRNFSGQIVWRDKQ